MAAEGTPSQVKIPADSADSGAHNVRTLRVPNPNLTAQSEDGVGTVTPTVEEQQVVSIADAHGDLVDVEDGALLTADHTTHQLLRGLLARLDILNDALTRNYSPPDDLGLGG